MKLTFFYTYKSYGKFRWSVYTYIPTIVNGKTTSLKIEEDTCSTMFGATWALKRKIRQHLRSGSRDEKFERTVNVPY